MDTIHVVSPSFPMTSVSQAVATLDTTRTNLVNVASKTGEVLQAYADSMNQAFNIVDSLGNVAKPWYDLKGKLAKGVKEERAKFVTAMESKGFETGTIDVYWGRVKDASGRVKTNNRVSGGNSVDELNIRDLKTILNRIDNAETENAPLSNKVIDLLIAAADLMGIDTSAYAITGDNEE